MDVYDELVEYLLTYGYKIIRFDLYGRGGSDSPLLPNNIGLFTSQINDFIESINDEIGNNKIIMCGLSLGGEITTHYTSLFSSRISKIILLAPYGVKVKPLLSINLFDVPILKDIIRMIAILLINKICKIVFIIIFSQ